MTRCVAGRVVVGALAALACAEAAQAGLIFRRGYRRGNDCCCEGTSTVGYGNYSGYTSSGGYASTYAYTPMYSGQVTASAYADPNSFAATTGPVAADKARVRMHLPSADARLWINNQMVATSGVDRTFDLPTAAGQSQRFLVTVQWMKDGREVVRKKQIDPKGGQETDVTIRETDADATANEQLPVTPTPSDAAKPPVDKP